MDTTPVLAVIGGSGLYGMKDLKVLETVTPETPYGAVSSPILIGELAGRKVAFLARHGIGHTISPTEVNYRANIYALKMLGVRKIVSISACGSLREDYAPGHIVIPDNLVDFTKGRQRTFFEEGLVAHVGTAVPYCDDLSNQTAQAIADAGGTLHRGGTLITIEGPRFSTKAESNMFRQWGMAIIGMTAAPEAFLAREAEICYVTMAHVTDYDVWHVSEEPVTVDMVLRTLHNNTETAQQAILNLVQSPTLDADCPCQHALQGALITDPTRIRPETRQKLAWLVDRYLP
jgi:5'-methylthioadenosine phosphorylase